MRDGNQTGYAPKPIEGVTPMQRVEVEGASVPCDGEIAASSLGHPRIWLRIGADQGEVTCPYCSITYVLKPGADLGGH